MLHKNLPEAHISAFSVSFPEMNFPYILQINPRVPVSFYTNSLEDLLFPENFFPAWSTKKLSSLPPPYAFSKA